MRSRSSGVCESELDLVGGGQKSGEQARQGEVHKGGGCLVMKDSRMDLKRLSEFRIHENSDK